MSQPSCLVTTVHCFAIAGRTGARPRRVCALGPYPAPYQLYTPAHTIPALPSSLTTCNNSTPHRPVCWVRTECDVETIAMLHWVRTMVHVLCVVHSRPGDCVCCSACVPQRPLHDCSTQRGRYAAHVQGWVHGVICCRGSVGRGGEFRVRCGRAVPSPSPPPHAHASHVCLLHQTLATAVRRICSTNAAERDHATRHTPLTSTCQNLQVWYIIPRSQSM